MSDQPDSPTEDAGSTPGRPSARHQTSVSPAADTKSNIYLGFEAGFLTRIRCWRDAMPWLSIGEALRPASSVSSWTLVGLAVWATAWLHYGLPISSWTQGPELAPSNDLIHQSAWALQFFVGETWTTLGGPWLQLVAGPVSWSDVGHVLLHQALTLLIWAIPAGVLIRQAALCIAGRPALGTLQTARFILQRLPAFLGVFLLPLVVLLLGWGYFAVADWVHHLPAVGAYAGPVVEILGIPVQIAVALIGFGSLFALPLAWAAIAIERDGSGFDALSRGYEYFLRRPVQFVGYTALGLVVTAILRSLAMGLAMVAIGVVDPDLDGSNYLSRQVAEAIPNVVTYCLLFCLVAWLYLLLRHSANHQELEDVWEVPRPAPTPLPTLAEPSSPSDSADQS